jgi:hypothetical protein
MTLSSIKPVTNDRIKLPEPDLRNITVLTRKLPNNPILPWNHYDSPWLEEEPHPDAESDQSDQPSEQSSDPTESK